jgi:hypothetical protein
VLELKPSLQSSQGRSKHWSGAELVNCFAEQAGGDKRSDFAVMASPGLTLWATVGAGPYRGHGTIAGVPYVVSGDGFYRVLSDGSSVYIGAIAGTGPVRVAANYTEIAIAANGTGYVYSSGALSTPLAFDVSDVFYADGYIVWVVEDSEQFFISALDDALTYDAADIASVEGFPDNIVGAINDHREIAFMGEKSIEIFYNSGATAFPFERQGNAFIERGCFDRDSIVKIDNSVTFMGEDRVIYTLNGYQPQRISTHAIEYQLRDATYARAWSYTQEGHKFYMLECDRGTFGFDHSTGAWHQRQSWDSTWWRCNGAIEAYDRLLLTDRATGKLYTPSLDVFTEADDIIAFEITLPTIEAGRGLKTCYSFEVVCETGVGNSAVSDPQIMLKYSDDGGHTWSDEMWRSLGAVGTYRTRAVWRRLGQFRNRQMKLRITDAARKLVISYHADIQ